MTHFVPYDGNLDASLIPKMRAAGVSDEAIKEAMDVGWCFINLSKWADALDFPVTPPAKFKPISKMMYKFGYTQVSV